MFDTIQPTRHNYSTRPRDQPILPISKTALAKQSIRFSLPEEIANIPEIIINKISTHSLDGFSKYVKQYLIGKYNPVCEIVNCRTCNTVP